jgi:hypothetical protein
MPRVDLADGNHLFSADGILAFHPDVCATGTAEVPMESFNARGGRLESEVGGGGEVEVRCSETLAEGAVCSV